MRLAYEKRLLTRDLDEPCYGALSVTSSSIALLRLWEERISEEPSDADETAVLISTRKKLGALSARLAELLKRSQRGKRPG